jgi:hypothetical protein
MLTIPAPVNSNKTRSKSKSLLFAISVFSPAHCQQGHPDA